MGKYTIKKKFVGGSDDLILKIAVLKKNKLVYYTEYHIVLSRNIMIDIINFRLFMEIIKNITEKTFIIPNYAYNRAGLIEFKRESYISFSNSKFTTENLMLDFDNIKLSKEHVEAEYGETPKYADSIMFRTNESVYELKINNDLIELFIELEKKLNYFL